VIFSSVVDLPYIMTLIRQAFDKQALKEQAD
jgi:predicted transport protein